MCERLLSRVAFGKPLAEQGVWEERIADARIAIDQARLYTLYTAWLMDTQGNKAARAEIAGIKVAVPLMALEVIDDAIQAYGAAGVSQDTPAGPDVRLDPLPAPRRRARRGAPPHRRPARAPQARAS